VRIGAFIVHCAVRSARHGIINRRHRKRETKQKNESMKLRKNLLMLTSWKVESTLRGCRQSQHRLHRSFSILQIGVENLNSKNKILQMRLKERRSRRRKDISFEHNGGES